MDITFWVLVAAGLITGFSKFSTGGMGLIILPILTLAFPGPQAVALVVPMYIITDVFAVMSYRRQISWRTLWQLIPVAVLGVFIGTYFLTAIEPQTFNLLLGWLVLGMLALGIWLDIHKADFMRHPVMVKVVGFFAGIITIMANAAGPLISLFLMEQRLSKDSYVATRAWIFLLLNVIKVPMLIAVGLLNMHVLQHTVTTLPSLAVGACLGYFFLKHIKVDQFKWLIRIVAALAAVKLLLF